MKKLTSAAFLTALAVLTLPAPGQADVSAGVSIDEDGLKGFYLAIGEHYGVPEKEVVIVRERKIPDEELPVIYFLAHRVEVSPDVIIKLRLGGKSWMDISAHFGLSPDVYYVPVKSDPGPPYGKAYGHFKNRKKNPQQEVVLTDVDVVNLVNLRFISEHYGCSPEDVIKFRSEGKSFVEINKHVKSARNQKSKGQSVASRDETSKTEAAKGNSQKGKKK